MARPRANLAYIHFTFALKAIHITLSRAFKPQFTRESRVTHARGLSTRCEHKHNDCAIGGRLRHKAVPRRQCRLLAGVG